jgi:hypothetical protein
MRRADGVIARGLWGYELIKKRNMNFSLQSTVTTYISYTIVLVRPVRILLELKWNFFWVFRIEKERGLELSELPSARPLLPRLKIQGKKGGQLPRITCSA